MPVNFDEIPESVYDMFINEQFGHLAIVEKPQFYNFVCPNCGDMKFPNKKKAYVYKDKWLYKCYKCGTSISFAMHLKQNDPEAYQRLLFSAFGDEKNWKSKKESSKPAEKPSVLPFIDGELKSVMDNNLVSRAALDLCKRRMIREEVYADWFACIPGEQFYHRDENGTVLINPSTGRPVGNEYRNRIIIPFYHFGGKWDQFDARAIDGNNPLRYMNFTGVKRTAYNIDFINYDKPFFILEGTIDSTFIRNSIAIGGIEHLDEILADNPEILKHKGNCVMLWDNDEPGNKARWDTCKADFRWFDWSGIHSKDVNGAVMSGEFNLDQDGYVSDDIIMKRVRDPSAAEILFMLQYGNVAKQDYIRRKNAERDNRKAMARHRDPEVLF